MAAARAHGGWGCPGAPRAGDGAELLDERRAGDLRRLSRKAEDDIRTLRGLIQEEPGIGPADARSASRAAPDEQVAEDRLRRTA
ncbi:hypothetical protein [Streptomyces sp. SCL15-4]|uniref:hypothetical protein n=1 Tax=Streptomyces sp. SCL15-4 TaxID=2967221 RepID=UPI002966E969|nr:hypothetical protein [Streptomyces sp. SCL15-4]